MSSKHPDKRRLVLFVDDDPSLLKLGRISLERAGYQFIGASNGRQGLEFAQEVRPDLILLDYMMPGISGKEVFVEITESADERLRHTPVVMLTARTDNHAEQRELLEMGLAAYLCKPFGHHELLNVIANVLVTAQIKERNRMLEREARQSFISTARSLISLLAAKDSYTGEHSNMMVDMAEALALVCCLSETEVVNIKLGALLHDIGKIGVPENILLKPGRLTPDEMDVMRRHVDYGAHALEGIPHMEGVRLIVKHHHEWWNGGGYPARLKADAIPFGARLVAVVDAYDAMTSNRPYRQGLPRATAIERLRAAIGIQFDHDLVEKFVECLDLYDDERTRSMNLQFLEELHQT
jgi:putative two-component system response regulator